ncbi:hypothetical protein OG444_23995 [Streptomyces sp. NBC_01232]|nr:hypothetical protein OG444_23995 [Streptomyces sp. NBC_01232]
MSAPAPYLSAYDSWEGLVAAAEEHYVPAPFGIDLDTSDFPVP